MNFNKVSRLLEFCIVLAVAMLGGVASGQEKTRPFGKLFGKQASPVAEETARLQRQAHQ